MADHKDDKSQLGKDIQTLAFLRKLQAATGLVIATFTALHLGNHFLMHFGLDAHRFLFLRARKVYTNPLAETVLLSSIGIHALLGIYRYKGLSQEWPRRLFQMCGWALITIIPGHVYATRVWGEGAKMQDFDVTFAGMATRLIPYFFIPYYAAFSAAGAYHMYCGVAKAGVTLRIPALAQIPQHGSKFVKYTTVLALMAASCALAISGVYFSYPMVEEALLIKDYFSHWPESFTRHIKLPEAGEWFASFRFNV